MEALLQIKRFFHFIIGSHSVGTYILGVLLVFSCVAGNSLFYIFVRYNTLTQERSEEVDNSAQTQHSDDKSNNVCGKSITQESLTTNHKLFLETQKKSIKSSQETKENKNIALEQTSLVQPTDLRKTLEEESAKEPEIDYRLPIFYSGLGYVIWYILIRLITRQPLEIAFITDKYLFLMLIGGTLYYIATIFDVACLLFESASITTMLKNTELLWGNFFNMTVNDMIPTLLGLFGFSMAVLANVGIALYAFYKWENKSFLFKKV